MFLQVCTPFRCTDTLTTKRILIKTLFEDKHDKRPVISSSTVTSYMTIKI